MNANLNRKYYYAFFALALCALIVPLWLVELPPLVDLPNHLARVFILANYAETPFFQQNFQILYEPIPNLAVDLIVVPLMSLFNIWTANHLFLTLTVVLFAVGCHLTGARTGEKPSFSIVLAMFLIYGGTFFYGYVNYIFGVSLFLITFGLWMRWRAKLDFIRFSALAVLTFAIYLSHLSAFTFFGAAVFFVNLYDFFASREERRKWIFLAADAALFILPAIAFLTFMGGTGEVGTITWNSVGGKAIALFGPFRSYDLWLDLTCVALTASVCLFLKRWRQAVFDRRMLSLASFFFVLFLISPNILFTSGDADMRIVLPAFVLLILSCKINSLRGKAFAFFVLAICLLVVRQGVISYRWLQMSERMAAEIKLLEVVPPQSKVYPIFVNEGVGAEEKFERPILHVVQFVTFMNSSFASTVFAYRGQQPLGFRRPEEAMRYEDKTKWLQYLGGNDYVWTHGVAQNVSDELEKRAQVVAEGGKTKIWKLNK